jgi:uncharacterized membrane-anchored protein YjiN (DUF445 family)
MGRGTTIWVSRKTKELLEEVKHLLKCRSHDEAIRKMCDVVIFRLAQPSRDIDEVLPSPEEVERMSEAEILDTLYRLNRRETVLRMVQKLLCRSGSYLGKEIGRVIERMASEGAPEEEIQEVVKIATERKRIADTTRHVLKRYWQLLAQRGKIPA